jgi:hypothetical protein
VKGQVEMFPEESSAPPIFSDSDEDEAGEIIDAVSVEVDNSDRVFTINFDITVNLDQVLRDILTNDMPPEARLKAERDIASLWDSSDLTIIDIITKDLENTLDGASSIVPREFERI